MQQNPVVLQPGFAFNKILTRTAQKGLLHALKSIWGFEKVYRLATSIALGCVTAYSSFDGCRANVQPKNRPVLALGAGERSEATARVLNTCKKQ